MSNHQTEIDTLMAAHLDMREAAKSCSPSNPEKGNLVKDMASAEGQPPKATHCFLSPPWELVEGSDEGNAVISLPMDSLRGARPWWTAIIVCTDRDVQNRVGRLMVSAPDLLAALKAALSAVELPTGIGIGIGGLEFRFPAWVEKARAAIAKAESQS